MQKKILITILVCVLLILNYYLIFSISPTKAEVESFLEENSCDSRDVETWYEVEELCVYHLRRHTTTLGGQIFNVPKYSFLFVYTPFNYYHTMDHGEDERYTYTWIDTREGRFVYNAVNGEYIGEIDSREDPMKKYLQDMDDTVEKMRQAQEKDN
ncbi:MAG: hypothetical protein KJ674_01650 [Nanoarchaeota archaeon]|nr:hypothetical protein [Nanoarchaeota archaeon]